MASICDIFSCCFPGEPREEDVKEKPQAQARYHDQTDEERADQVVAVLLKAKRNRQINKCDLNDIIDGQSWSEDIAKAILERLSDILGNGTEMSEELTKISDIVNGVAREVFRFVEKHPEATAIFCTLVAIGILFLISPWVLELLGFAEQGPVADTFAAWWESRYLGNIPSGSWFSFFQRLGMKP